MQINIEISTVLHDLIPFSGKNLSMDQWEVADGTQVQDILDTLCLMDVQIIPVLNASVACKKTVLKQGDTLRIFPLPTGG